MSSLAKKIIILLLISGIHSVSYSSASFSGIFNRRKPVTADTSEVNRYVEKVFSEGKKSTELMKAYIDSAEMICRERNIEMPPSLHLARAEYFFNTNDFKHTSQETGIALKIAKSRKDLKTELKAMLLMGRYNFKSGMIEQSILNFRDCIDMAEKEKIKGIIPVAYLGLVDIYNKLENIGEFRKTLFNMIDAAVAEKDTMLMERAYHYLGSSFSDVQRNPAMADSLLRLALKLSFIKKDSSMSALSLANLGWNFYQDKKYDSAITYYNRSLRYSIHFKVSNYAANALGNLGTIYRDMNKTGAALKYYNEALYQAKKSGDLYSLWWVNRDMSEMYLSKSDTGKAFMTYVEYKKYYDDWVKSRTTQGLADAKIRYEAESQNREVELLNLRVKNQRLLIYGSSGLFLLSLAVLILYLSRARINSKRKISEMNRKISEITQANLRQQMNPHFIFNTLNSIQYYMYRHDKLATNNYLTKFSNLMRKVLENSQNTSVPLRDELDALNLYLELEKIRFKDKFDYEINVDEDIDTIQYRIPTMLIQPYVENSICHGLVPSEEKGLIRIDMKLNKGYISCTIEDNGIGREAALAKNSDHNKNHHSMGTRIVTSRLELVNALYGTNLKTVYTDLKKDSGEPEGTRVEIHIPILT